MQCQAITLRGTRCKRKAKQGRNFCFQHSNFPTKPVTLESQALENFEKWVKKNRNKVLTTGGIPLYENKKEYVFDIGDSRIKKRITNNMKTFWEIPIKIFENIEKYYIDEDGIVNVLVDIPNYVVVLDKYNHKDRNLINSKLLLEFTGEEEYNPRIVTIVEWSQYDPFLQNFKNLGELHIQENNSTSNFPYKNKLGIPPEKCPICRLKGEYQYRQRNSPMYCKNGHVWFLCETCSNVTIERDGTIDDISCKNKECPEFGIRWIDTQRR